MTSLVASDGPRALVYWRGAYDRLGWSNEEILRSIGLTPIRSQKRAG